MKTPPPTIGGVITQTEIKFDVEQAKEPEPAVAPEPAPDPEPEPVPEPEEEEKPTVVNKWRGWLDNVVKGLTTDD